MKRVQWPQPQPQPTTPLQGGVVPITFAEYHRARTGRATPAVQRLYDTHGAYTIKPKRGSRGVVWNNQAFWWSTKGHYRGGRGAGPWRPVQHLIWEAHHRRKMPKGHEIFFLNRDRPAFRLARAVAMLPKAEVHRRVHLLGETRSLSFEERSQIAGRRWCKKSRDVTALLLTRTQSTTTKHHAHSHLAQSLR